MNKVRVVIEFDIDNADFRPDPRPTISQMIIKAAQLAQVLFYEESSESSVEFDIHEMKALRDTNGNTIGRVMLEAEYEKDDSDED